MTAANRRAAASARAQAARDDAEQLCRAYIAALDDAHTLRERYVAAQIEAEHAETAARHAAIELACGPDCWACRDEHRADESRDNGGV